MQPGPRGARLRPKRALPTGRYPEVWKVDHGWIQVVLRLRWNPPRSTLSPTAQRAMAIVARYALARNPTHGKGNDFCASLLGSQFSVCCYLSPLAYWTDPPGGEVRTTAGPWTTRMLSAVNKTGRNDFHKTSLCIKLPGNNMYSHDNHRSDMSC